MHSLSLRFGRRIILTWSYLLLGVLGCSSSLSPTYTAYCTFRFLSGMAVSGIIINGVSLSTCLQILLSYCPHISLSACLSEVDPFAFTYLSSEVEWIPTRERTLVGTLTSFFFTFGQMILAGLAYWLRDWRKLQVVVCAPHFLFFAYSWSVVTVKINVYKILCSLTARVALMCLLSRRQVVLRVGPLVGSQKSIRWCTEQPQASCPYQWKTRSYR